MKLNYATYINAMTSYSLAGLNFLREMVKAGVDIKLFPMDQPTQATNEFGEVVQRTYYQNSAPHHWKDAPSLRFAHPFDGFNHVSKKRILYTVFEIDKFSSLEESSLLSNDLVITSNNYHADVLRTIHGNVAVVPLGVNHNIFNPYTVPSLRPQLGIPEDATVFINVGKWERRKCHREICDAFNLAFDPGDNVHLIMFPENGFIKEEVHKEWSNFYLNSKMGKHIHLCKKTIKHIDIASWIKSADCMVAPSRAEGYNLPALESLSCGLHLITTNVTAMADYCSNINSHLIELNGMELAYDEPFFRGQGHWYKWEQKHTRQLADLFNHIHHLKQHDELKQNIEGLATASALSWTNVSRELIDVIFS